MTTPASRGPSARAYSTLAARGRAGLAIAALALALPAVAGAGLDPRIICQPCAFAEECGDHTDLCLSYAGIGRTGAFCGMHCLTDGDCLGLRCLETTVGLSQCADVEGLCRTYPLFECGLDEHCATGRVCVEGRCLEGGEPGLGDPCDERTACPAGLECVLTLVGQVCTEGCDWLRPTSCPDGFFCTERNRCGEGICVPGRAGAGEQGASCALDTECRSLFCTAVPGTAGASCSEPCDPAAPACPDGLHCERRAAGCGSCVVDCVPGSCPAPLECTEGRCVGLLADGQPCAADAECLSALCEGGVCGGRPASDGGPGVLPEDDLYLGSCACRAPGAGRAERQLPALLEALLALLRGPSTERAPSPAQSQEAGSFTSRPTTQPSGCSRDHATRAESRFRSSPSDQTSTTQASPTGSSRSTEILSPPTLAFSTTPEASTGSTTRMSASTGTLVSWRRPGVPSRSGPPGPGGVSRSALIRPGA